MSPIAEYDAFDFKLTDEPVLSLEEAERKAAGLRSGDPHHIYRILPADPNQTGFIVVKIPAQQAYAEVWGRMLAHLYHWFPPQPGR